MNEIETYIRQVAREEGVDPDTAVRVARSEGGLKNWVRQSEVIKSGVRERSYGPFQLYMNGGLGNRFQKQTGLDPSTAEGAKPGIRFALQVAKKEGWGQWYGAAKVGVGNWEGLNGKPTTRTKDTPISADALEGVAGLWQPTPKPGESLMAQSEIKAQGPGQSVVDSKVAGILNTPVDTTTPMNQVTQNLSGLFNAVSPKPQPQAPAAPSLSEMAQLFKPRLQWAGL